jgi:uncharacterized protein YijF (DUF1287 family)
MDLLQRREFLAMGLAALVVQPAPSGNGEKLAAAARQQLGVTTGYDPSYTKLTYPGGDVPRTTGVCADVIVRAGRDALALDLQKLVHEDMAKDFAAYPRNWGTHAPDANIDHRRVPNLETFWKRAGGELWVTPGKTAGDDFGGELKPGDLLTWRLDARLPHVGMVVGHGLLGTRVVHNIGAGVEEISLLQMRGQRAQGHYRWPV